MGWNPINDIKKLYNKIKDAVEDGMNKIKRAAEDGFKRIKREAERGVEEIRGKGKWYIGKIEQVGKDAENTAKNALGDVEKIAKGAIDDVEKAASTVKDEVEKIPALAEDAVEQAFEAVVKGFTEEGLKTVQSVLSTTHKELTKLRDKKPDLVDAIDELGFYGEFGPITATYSGFYTRFEQLSDALSKPPALKRKQIIDFLRATGPTSINFGISVQVVALVVGSKELGVGGGLNDIPAALAWEILDIILEAAGVPE